MAVKGSHFMWMRVGDFILGRHPNRIPDCCENDDVFWLLTAVDPLLKALE